MLHTCIHSRDLMLVFLGVKGRVHASRGILCFICGQWEPNAESTLNYNYNAMLFLFNVQADQYYLVVVEVLI